MSEAQAVERIPEEVRIPFLNDFTRKCKIYRGPQNPECGNGRHSYQINSFNDDGTITHQLNIHFQEGALTANPQHNGIFGVALLCVAVDHLESFQDGEFASDEGAQAIIKLKEAVHWLCARSDERSARGVLGKHEK